MEMEIDTLITVGGYVLTPISGVVSWFAAKRVRNNETLNKLQETIFICKGEQWCYGNDNRLRYNANKQRN